MKHDNVTTLYRYTTAERAICVLSSKRIFFPKPSRFNDPFDCAIYFDPEITAAELAQASFLTYNEQNQLIQKDGTIAKVKRDEMVRVAHEFKDKNAAMGVLSLSEDPLSPLMWAHYADHHRGVCLGFSRITANTLGEDDITSPVLYSDVYPRVRFSEILKRDGSIHQKLFFTKARDWAYEKEWRLLAGKGDVVKNIPGDIVEVIVGCRVDPSHADAVSKLCSDHSITVFQCEMVPDKFQYRRRNRR